MTIIGFTFGFVMMLLSNVIFVFFLCWILANYWKRKGVYRSLTDKMLGGVCGGLAQAWKIDAIWVRLGFLSLIFFLGATIFLYIFLWFFMPKEG